MKREKGITLISLIIYIIVLLIVLTMLTKITSSLYSNVKEIDSDFDIAVDIAKFNMYFLNDIEITEIGKNIQVYLKIGDYSKTTSYIIEPKPI